MGRKIKLTKRDLEEFAKFHREHLRDPKCILAWENNEPCLHEIMWLLSKGGLVED